ncbi:unnamed protein product [Cyclocybe aegerita]|uniref:Uncharacterized protein n=1 Tax=Cyclocybe aegerita TaxID=1973307 RepID=A0A8S0WB43_CYCAE|nr:unnamed protein product [Cyclocybe aegerita]
MRLPFSVSSFYADAEVRSTPRELEVPSVIFDFIPYIMTWNILQAFALVLHISVLTTVLHSRNIRRSPTWLLLVFSGMLYSASCLFIVTQQVGPPPSTSICVIQATLIYACPAMNGAAVCSFMLQAYWVVASLGNLGSAPVYPKFNRWVLVIPPFVFYVVLAEVLIVYAVDDSGLERDLSGTHCGMKQNRLPVRVTAAVVVICSIVVLILEAFIYTKLRKEWDRNVKSLCATQMPPRVIARVAIFGLFAVSALVISFALSGFTLESYNSPIAAAGSNLAIAIMQAAQALILGTQRDILSVWMFWKKRQPSY